MFKTVFCTAGVGAFAHGGYGADIVTWGKARCYLWVSLEVWPKATLLAVVAACTLCLSTIMSKLWAPSSVLVQGAIGGDVPRPVLPTNAMEAPEDGKCCVSFFV
jgi:hypothetical protein